MSPKFVEEAEVVVVGGGPSGSVAAAKLAELGHDVLVIDQSTFPRDKPCGDGMTHAAVAFCERHGLGQLMDESQVIEDVRGIIAHSKQVTGIYRPWPTPPKYARVTPRRELDRQLFGIATSNGARFLNARVDQPLLDGDGAAQGVQLSGPDGGKVKARLVIAADGATSRMRRTSPGMPKERKGSHIFAFRLYATTEKDLDPVYDFHLPLLYEGGLLAGYGWVFPVGDKRANIGVAYYEPPLGRPRARIREVLQQFLDELQDKSAHQLGALSDMTDPIGAPIATQFVPDRCDMENMIFAGEAARAADPLNGEGISFALQSGEMAAHEARRLLTGAPGPDQGKRIGRRFARIGSDLTMPARLVAGATTGLTLADRAHQPYMHRVRRVMAFGLDEPTLVGTELRERLADTDLALAQSLDRVNERAQDTLRSSLPFALETTHRELRSGGGPVAAATALASARAVGAELDERHVAAATGVELTALIGSFYPEVMAETGTDVARLNNTLALLTAESVLAGAIESGAAASPEAGAEIATAARMAFEALGSQLDGSIGPENSPASYLATAGARTGGAVALGAHLGAQLASANGVTDTLTTIGEQLGRAWQIGTDLMDATTGDELAGRPPGAALRAGQVTLPLLHAIDTDESLAEAIEGKIDGALVRRMLDTIRSSGALDRSEQDRAQYIERALDLIDGAGLPNPEPLRALARFCGERAPVPA